MSTLTGTSSLVRLALRRDRLWLLPWLLGIVALAASTASSFAGLYPTVASRLPLAATADANPALLAMSGRGYELTSLGGLSAWRIGVFAALIAALMNIFLVTRHTRADEESGRTELVGSAVVGRRAALSAALIAAAVADLILIALLTAGLAASGDLPLNGSFALASGIGLAGAAFAGITAIAAQCATTARGTTAIAGAVLGFAFLLRAAGDLSDNWLVWLSPLGWVTRVRAFAGEQWWVLGLFAVLILTCVGVSFGLAQHREYGAGLLATRGGRSGATAWLSGPLGLAWRLQRGSILGWCLGLAVVGAAFGALAYDVGDLVQGNPQLIEILQRLGGADAVADAYLSTTLGMVGLVASGYAVSSVLRLRQEETSGYAEALLATPLARIRWASGHTVVAAGAATLLLAVVGAGAGLVYGLRAGDVPGQLGRLTLAALAQTPAVWIIGAATVLLVGWLPRAAAAAWGLLVACVVLGQFGAILSLPTAVIDLSPFGHVPGVGQVTAAPLAVLTAIAVGLAVVGLVGLRRRDIG